MNKTWRRRLIVLAVVAVCIFVTASLVPRFGRSYARREIEAKLRQVGAGPVEIGDVTLGWTQVVARDIRILDPSHGEPWLVAEVVIAKVNVWDAMFGDTRPQQIVIDGGKLTLRFDADGNLLTRLPELSPGEQLPSDVIRLSNASIALEQAGAAPLLATQIDGQLTTGAQTAEAMATIGDALGSTWKLKATGDDVSTLTLSTSELQLTGSALSRLPGVPDGIAGIERLSGAVRIDLHLASTSESAESPYLEVTVASLRATAPVGDWQLEDGAVRFSVGHQGLQLNNFSGNVAGGRATLAGEINLTDETGNVRGRFEEIALTELPDDWNIPSRVAGRLTGETSLQFEYSDREISVSATARGTLDQARLAGLAIDPVALDVKLDPWALGDKPAGRLIVGLSATDLDVHEFLTTLDATANQFAVVPRGRLTGSLQLTAPLQALGDPQRYHGQGSLSSKQITIGKQIVQNVRADLLVQQGKVSLDDAGFAAAGGTVHGKVTAELGTGVLNADLAWDALSVGQLAGMISTPSGEIDGAIGGKIALNVSLSEVADLDAWSAQGSFQSDQIKFPGAAVTATAGSFQLADGVLQFAGLRTAHREAMLTGEAALHLHPPHEFEAHLASGEMDIARIIAEFPAPSNLPDLQGTANVKANLSGTLKPLQWQADGGVEFAKVMWKPWGVDRGQAEWHLNAERLKVTRFDGEALGGTLAATASIPFDGGPIKAAGTFADLASESLLGPADIEARLSGPISGSFSATLPRDDKSPAAQVEFRSPLLSANAIEMSSLTGRASYVEGAVQLQFSGRTWDGNVSVDGSGRLGADRSNLQFDGKIQAEGVDLSALASLTENPQLRPLKGTADAEIAFSIRGSDWKPTGHGTLSARRLRWNNLDIAPSLNARIKLSQDVLVVQDISARLAEGTARGEISVPLTATPGGTFRLTLERVGSRRLLALWPGLGDVADGPLDLYLEGRMDRRWYGSARLQMSRAVIVGIPMQRLKAPFHWTFAPESNRFQINAHDASVHLGGGRVTADLEMTLGRRLDIKCAGRMQTVDLRTLLKNAPGASRTLDGALSADFAFAGRDVRSAKDLTGTYKANLVQARSMLLPVFQDLAAAIGIGSLTRRFDTTESRGRLTKGGVVRIDQMFLANSDVQMEIDGRVWLTGRVDLDVTAHAGEFAATSLLGQLLRSPLRFIQPVGIGLLIQANDFFERRMLFFNVGGTIRNPIVRPRANEFLNQEVILFFLDEASSQLLR